MNFVKAKYCHLLSRSIILSLSIVAHCMGDGASAGEVQIEPLSYRYSVDPNQTPDSECTKLVDGKDDPVVWHRQQTVNIDFELGSTYRITRVEIDACRNTALPSLLREAELLIDDGTNYRLAGKLMNLAGSNYLLQPKPESSDSSVPPLAQISETPMKVAFEEVDQETHRLRIVLTDAYQPGPHFGISEVRIFGQEVGEPIQISVTPDQQRRALAAYAAPHSDGNLEFREGNFDEDPDPELFLANRFISCVIEPASGGVIGSFQYKGIEFTQPKTPLAPGGGGGLLSDHVASQSLGGDWFNAPYDYRLIDNSENRISLKLSATGKSGPLNYLTFNKTITLWKDRSDVQVDYEISLDKKATAPLPFAFWFHSYVGVRSDGRKSPSAAYLFPDESGIQRVDWSTQKGTDRWFSDPARGWAAVVDDRLKAGLAFIIDDADLRSFHTWGSKGHEGLPTVSWRLHSVSIPDGGSYRTTVRLLPFTDLTSIDGTAPSIVGQIEILNHAETKTWSVAARLCAATAQPLRGHAVLRRRCLPDGGWSTFAEGDITLAADTACQFEGQTGTLESGTHLFSLQVTDANRRELIEIQRPLVIDRPSGRYVLTPRSNRQYAQESRVHTNYTSMDYETPHIKWAKPYAKGKIKALILIDGRYQREVIELAQRMDLDFDSTYLYPKYVFEAMADYYGQATERDLALGLERLLRENPDWEVLIMAGHMFRYFTPEQRKNVFEKINSGAGLVVVQPDITYPLSEISPLRPTGAMRPKWEAWRPARQHFITSAIPWEALPVDADVYSYEATPDAQVLARVGDDPLVAIRTVGKGRVVAAAYRAGDPSETPDSPGQFQGLTPFMTAADGGDHTPPPKFPYHEYYFSLLAKSVLWAAQKEPDVLIESIDIKSDRVTVHLENPRDAQEVAVEGTVSDKYGNLIAKLPPHLHELPIGGSRIEINLPADLRNGRNLVDLFVRDDRGSIVNWGSGSIDIAREAAISEITVNQEFYRPEDEVRVEIKTTPATNSADHVLRASLIDGYGRALAKQLAPVSNETTILRFTLAHPLNRLLVVEVALLREASVLDIAEVHKAVELPFRTSTHTGELVLEGWHNLAIYGLNNYLVEPYVQWMDDAGFNSAYVIRPDMTQTLRESLWRHNMSLQVRGPDMRLLPPRVTGDPAHPIRVPCVSDPEFIRSAVESEVVTGIGNRPGAYSVQAADEVSYGTGDEPEVCFSPYCMQAMRNWLHSEYPILEALNEQWGTQFKNWGDVRPLTRSEIEARGDRNYSSWCDHRSFGEIAVSHFYRTVAQAVGRSKQGALYGPSGNPEPGVDSGYDYWQLRDAFTSLNAYVGYDELALWAGDKMEILKYGQFDDPDTTRLNIYFHLMHGIQGTAVCGTQRLPAFDWTDSRTGRGYRLSYAPLRRGIGRLMVESRRVPDPIALHYSRNASRIADVLNHASLWSEMRWKLRTYLDSCGFDHGWISYEQLERGETNGLKVIYLPMSSTLSDGEIRSLERFVSGGGTLIGELAIGIADGHGRMLEQGRLDHVFGINREASKIETRRVRTLPVKNRSAIDFPPINVNYVENGLAPAGADVLALAESDQTPVAFAHPFGKGLAIYLACDVDSAFDEANSARGIGENGIQAAEVEHFMVKLAERASCRPRLRIIDKENNPVAYIKTTMFQQGSIRYFWLLRNFQLAKSFAPDPITATIDFGSPAFVREVFTNIDYGQTDRIETQLVPNALALYSVVPYDVQSIVMKRRETALPAPGMALSFDIMLRANVPMSTHTLRLDIIDPDGLPSKAYSCNLTAADGRASFSLPMSLNDKPGEWKILVKDLTSGKTAQETFQFK